MNTAIHARTLEAAAKAEVDVSRIRLKKAKWEQECSNMEKQIKACADGLMAIITETGNVGSDRITITVNTPELLKLLHRKVYKRWDFKIQYESNNKWFHYDVEKVKFILFGLMGAKVVLKKPTF